MWVFMPFASPAAPSASEESVLQAAMRRLLEDLERKQRSGQPPVLFVPLALKDDIRQELEKKGMRVAIDLRGPAEGTCSMRVESRPAAGGERTGMAGQTPIVEVRPAVRSAVKLNEGMSLSIDTQALPKGVGLDDIAGLASQLLRMEFLVGEGERIALADPASTPEGARRLDEDGKTALIASLVRAVRADLQKGVKPQGYEVAVREGEAVAAAVAAEAAAGAQIEAENRQMLGHMLEYAQAGAREAEGGPLEGEYQAVLQAIRRVAESPQPVRTETLDALDRLISQVEERGQIVQLGGRRVRIPAGLRNGASVRVAGKEYVFDAGLTASLDGGGGPILRESADGQSGAPRQEVRGRLDGSGEGVRRTLGAPLGEAERARYIQLLKEAQARPALWQGSSGSTPAVLAQAIAAYLDPIMLERGERGGKAPLALDDKQLDGLARFIYTITQGGQGRVIYYPKVSETGPGYKKGDSVYTEDVVVVPPGRDPQEYFKAEMARRLETATKEDNHPAISVTARLEAVVGFLLAGKNAEDLDYLPAMAVNLDGKTRRKLLARVIQLAEADGKTEAAGLYAAALEKPPVKPVPGAAASRTRGGRAAGKREGATGAQGRMAEGVTVTADAPAPASAAPQTERAGAVSVPSLETGEPALDALYKEMVGRATAARPAGPAYGSRGAQEGPRQGGLGALAEAPAALEGAEGGLVPHDLDQAIYISLIYKGWDTFSKPTADGQTDGRDRFFAAHARLNFDAVVWALVNSGLPEAQVNHYLQTLSADIEAEGKTARPRRQEVLGLRRERIAAEMEAQLGRAAQGMRERAAGLPMETAVEAIVARMNGEYRQNAALRGEAVKVVGEIVRARIDALGEDDAMPLDRKDVARRRLEAYIQSVKRLSADPRLAAEMDRASADLARAIDGNTRARTVEEAGAQYGLDVLSRLGRDIGDLEGLVAGLRRLGADDPYGMKALSSKKRIREVLGRWLPGVDAQSIPSQEFEHFVEIVKVGHESLRKEIRQRYTDPSSGAVDLAALGRDEDVMGRLMLFAAVAYGAGAMGEGYFGADAAHRLSRDPAQNKAETDHIYQAMDRAVDGHFRYYFGRDAAGAPVDHLKVYTFGRTFEKAYFERAFSQDAALWEGQKTGWDGRRAVLPDEASARRFAELCNGGQLPAAAMTIVRAEHGRQEIDMASPEARELLAAARFSQEVEDGGRRLVFRVDEDGAAVYAKRGGREERLAAPEERAALSGAHFSLSFEKGGAAYNVRLEEGRLRLSKASPFPKTGDYTVTEERIAFDPHAYRPEEESPRKAMRAKLEEYTGRVKEAQEERGHRFAIGTYSFDKREQNAQSEKKWWADNGLLVADIAATISLFTPLHPVADVYFVGRAGYDTYHAVQNMQEFGANFHNVMPIVVSGLVGAKVFKSAFKSLTTSEFVWAANKSEYLAGRLRGAYERTPAIPAAGEGLAQTAAHAPPAAAVGGWKASTTMLTNLGKGIRDYTVHVAREGVIDVGLHLTFGVEVGNTLLHLDHADAKTLIGLATLSAIMITHGLHAKHHGHGTAHGKPVEAEVTKIEAMPDGSVRTVVKAEGGAPREVTIAADDAELMGLMAREGMAVDEIAATARVKTGGRGEPMVQVDHAHPLVMGLNVVLMDNLVKELDAASASPAVTADLAAASRTFSVGMRQAMAEERAAEELRAKGERHGEESERRHRGALSIYRRSAVEYYKTVSAAVGEENKAQALEDVLRVIGREQALYEFNRREESGGLSRKVEMSALDELSQRRLDTMATIDRVHRALMASR